MLTREEANELLAIIGYYDLIPELKKCLNKKINELIEKPKREIDGKYIVFTYEGTLTDYRDSPEGLRKHRSFDMAGEWIHFSINGWDLNLDKSKRYKLVEVEDD